MGVHSEQHQACRPATTYVHPRRGNEVMDVATEQFCASLNRATILHKTRRTRMIKCRITEDLGSVPSSLGTGPPPTTSYYVMNRNESISFTACQPRKPRERTSQWKSLKPALTNLAHQVALPMPVYVEGYLFDGEEFVVPFHQRTAHSQRRPASLAVFARSLQRMYGTQTRLYHS